MSLWTLSIADDQALLDPATHALIDKDVRYVLDYLDRFIDWKGTLDVRVNIRSHAQLLADLPGWDYDGIMLATEMSWITENGELRKANFLEMQTGVDHNGDAPDAGFTIYLGQDGKLSNYGAPLWLDPDPQFQVRPPIPPGAHDFVSLALHELVHTLAFDYANVPTSTLGAHVTERDGLYYFSGPATLALLGQPLVFEPGGHLLGSLTPFFGDSGLMRDTGNYEQNRWDIGRIELAVMSDLGLDVNGDLDGLPLADVDDKRPYVFGTTGNDVLYGDFQDNVLLGGAGNDVLIGGKGIDTAAYSGVFADYTISRSDGAVIITDLTGVDGVDTLIDVQRLQFADGMRALDIDGNAGQAYRIYKAAMNREPDLPGLGYWLDQMDKGVALATLAQGFVASEEFNDIYGHDLTPGAFVGQLYQNILGRPAEPGGYAFWVNFLEANDTLANRGWVLSLISESAENVDGLAPLIGQSIAYEPWIG